MKHNFIKTVLMLVLCFVFGTSAAHVIVVDNQLKSKMDTKYQVKNESTSSKKSADSNLISVTCKLEGDAATYRLSGSVTVSGPNFSEDFFASDDNKTIMCQIPAGNFDFISTARLLANRKSTGAIVYNVKEQVNIQHDTTIVFDFAESTTRYDFQMFKPDGTQALLDVLQMSPDGLSADTISHGNINYLGLSADLILKGVGLVASSRYQFYYENYGSYPCGTFFINNLSERYKIGAYATFDDNENAYIAKLETSDMAETVIKNNADGYVLYQEQFEPSLANNLNGEGVPQFNVTAMLDGKNFGSASGQPLPKLITQNRTVKAYVNAPESTCSESKYDIMVCAAYINEMTCQVDTFEFEIDDEPFVWVETTYTYGSPVIGLPVKFDAEGEIEYVNAGHDEGGDYSFHIPEPAKGEDIMEYPGHPQFSYIKDQKAFNYGSNCPINAFMAKNLISSGQKQIDLSCCYIGRYGEVRNDDCSKLQTEIKYNDEIICNNYGQISSAMNNFAAQGNPNGVITAHFENTNAVVDGLQSKNVTDVYFDQRQEDWTAPTLQMLLFKDRKGNIIDRFETADDGTLEFAGGDFNFNMEFDRTWFDCKPMNVEVSYSPYNGNSWETLDVTEIPENYFMPGFGYFYRGLLQNVEGEGWFDLKVKLTDLSGNWQEQVISPAFRIEGTMSGIGNVKVGNATEVARYTVDGRAISEPQAGVNIVKMSDGSVKKVWVK